MCFTPSRLATGTLVVVTGFGFEDTKITAGQGLCAGKTVPIVVGFLDFTPTSHAVDRTGKIQDELAAEQGVQRNEQLIEWELVLDGVALLSLACLHFVQVTDISIQAGSSPEKPGHTTGTPS